MTTIDQAQIVKWKELAEKATKEPWEIVLKEGHYSGVESPNGLVLFWIIDKINITDSEEARLKNANADFIAAARTAVPALIDAYEAALIRIAKLENVISEAIYGKQ